jgi:diguanylate cyclase (GGDEF)-like protein
MATVLLVGDVGPQVTGYTCHRAAAGDAVETAVRVHADVVVTPADAGVVEALRADYRTRLASVLVVADPSADEDLLAGADEYVLTPDEIATRVRILLLRPSAARALDPLTGLAGKTLLMEEIATRLKSRRHFAALYADLHDFASYNQRYGFERGDAAINVLGETIRAVLAEHPSAEHFPGHIGGDDFLVLTDRFIAQDVARDIVARFDEAAPELYDAEDRARGYVEITDRKGETSRAPMLSVSIGITVSGPREFHSYAELEHVAEEMNAVAKKEPGSAWALDRRRGPV